MSRRISILPHKRRIYFISEQHLCHSHSSRHYISSIITGIMPATVYRYLILRTIYDRILCMACSMCVSSRS